MVLLKACQLFQKISPDQLICAHKEISVKFNNEKKSNHKKLKKT